MGWREEEPSSGTLVVDIDENMFFELIFLCQEFCANQSSYRANTA